MMTTLARRKRRGTNVVEFALLLPVYITFMFGALDLCWVFYHRSAAYAGTVEGCRAGSLLDPGRSELQLPGVLSATHTAIYDRIPLCEDGACTLSIRATNVTPARSLLCESTVRIPSLLGLFTDTVTTGSTFRMEYQRYVD